MRRYVIVLLLALPWPTESQDQSQEPYVPVGLFIGRIEEGARIFTPARLLPLDHPESLGHDFPTVQQLRGTELPALLWLGAQAGYRLGPTLQRYPREPSSTWPYAEFRAPPDSTVLADVEAVRRPPAESELPGLRAALFDGDALVVFIVDTRSLTLEERGMARATAMGLDVGRSEFLAALGRVGASLPGGGLRAVVFSP